MYVYVYVCVDIIMYTYAHIYTEYMGLPEEYDAEQTFVRHVVIPNAKRPVHELGHALYMNFYKEDVLTLLRTYQPTLQFIFAHYATLEAYHAAPLPHKKSSLLFPTAWGPGNGALRMTRTEFVMFCENFGIVGSASRLPDLPGELPFTRRTANWVFTSAKNGAEASEMCGECNFAQCAGCEHMTFREFVEAILRCAVILFPLEGMQSHEIDIAPVTRFDNVGTINICMYTYVYEYVSMNSYMDR